MMIVVVPTERPVISPVTYGTDEIGEVPREALIENATPKAIMPNPRREIKIFLNIILLFFTFV
jgi:hypothetical protein